MPSTARRTTPQTIIADPRVQRVACGPYGYPSVAHDWPCDAPGARAIQQALQAKVTIEDTVSCVSCIAGVDIGFEDQGRTTRAAAVVIDATSLDVIDSALIRQPTRMPYIPGLLSFREVPAGLAALAALRITPDLVMVDGHGIAHPRRLGVATHLGLVSGLPAIGVAKKRLVGHHKPVLEARLARAELFHRDEWIGTVLRSRAGVKPIFISPGHRVQHEDAVAWVIRTLTRYKLPEPTRQADKRASNR